MNSPTLKLKNAATKDLPLLAKLNLQLIQDQGHRNSMNEQELHHRMKKWLENQYKASFFTCNNETIGYALYREDPNSIYLRQFFIKPQSRRQGFGKQAFTLLTQQWKNKKPTIRLDVLSNNQTGIKFWQSIGFQDYCITMEKPLP